MTHYNEPVQNLSEKGKLLDSLTRVASVYGPLFVVAEAKYLQGSSTFCCGYIPTRQEMRGGQRSTNVCLAFFGYVLSKKCCFVSLSVCFDSFVN